MLDGRPPASARGPALDDSPAASARDCTPANAAIVLAAGAATRMGHAKQLLELGGAPLVRRAASAALAAGCAPVVVVLGAHAPLVAPALRGLEVQVVVHPGWERGLGSSIAAGVAALQRAVEEAVARADTGGRVTDAVLITLADQPLVGPAALRSLLDARRAACAAIAASRYAGTVGVPACFDRALLPSLLTLDGSTGCKPLLRLHARETVLVDCPEAALDVDTPEDYARLLASLRDDVSLARTG